MVRPCPSVLSADAAALALAMARDGSSGGVVRMAVITKDGVEREVRVCISYRIPFPFFYSELVYVWLCVTCVGARLLTNHQIVPGDRLPRCDLHRRLAPRFAPKLSETRNPGSKAPSLTAARSRP